MRILITGGHGFIGSRLASHFSFLGHKVIISSRNFHKAPFWLPKAEVIKLNLDSASLLKEACADVDVVIHAAGMNMQDCYENPVEALAINGLATGRLIAAASEAGVNKFIYLSTAHVYANPLVGIINEKTCPKNIHPYATSHLAGEQQVLWASEQKKIHGIILRLSNVFGTPINKEINCWMLLANNLCKQAVQNHKLIVLNNSHIKRDFIPMTEICRIIEVFLAMTFKDIQPGIFNIGSGETKSIFAMAKLIQDRCVKVLGFKPELIQKQNFEVDNLDTLNYESQKLTELGVIIDRAKIEIELDDLLRYCNAEFKALREVK